MNWSEPAQWEEEDSTTGGKKRGENGASRRGETKVTSHSSLSLCPPRSLSHFCSTSRRGGAHARTLHAAPCIPPLLLLIKKGLGHRERRKEQKGKKRRRFCCQDEQLLPKHGDHRRLRPAECFYSGHQSWNHGVLQVRECESFTCLCYCLKLRNELSGFEESLCKFTFFRWTRWVEKCGIYRAVWIFPTIPDRFALGK